VLPTLLFAAATAHASCEAPAAPSFEFVGQPTCVSLTFDGGATQLVSTCDQPVIIDQSVARGGSRAQVVPAQGQATLRDLSAFTLGMEGTIFQVVAVIAEPPTCDASAAVEEPEPASVGGSWLPAPLLALAAVWPFGG
jgi:hypothetical protein